MKGRLFVAIILLFATGCSSDNPDLAAVRRLASTDQLLIGDPVANGIGMVLVPIPAGEFQMGANIDTRPADVRFKTLMEDPNILARMEAGEFTEQELQQHVNRQTEEDIKRYNGTDTPQHPVRITRPFYISICEVTQQQYQAVMNQRPWEDKPLVGTGTGYPATYITWQNAADFCQQLSDEEGHNYRLPTEAEWEYCCRAGTTTEYSFGDNPQELGDHAWFDRNAYKAQEQYPHRVGKKRPNSWALFDMHGNTCEWCSDWLGAYPSQQEVVSDPVGPDEGRLHVWRGGSFSESAQNMRSSSRLSWNRIDYQPEFAAGFRVIREIPRE